MKISRGKTLVNEITGRKDYPVFVGMTDKQIFQRSINKDNGKDENLTVVEVVIVTGELAVKPIREVGSGREGTLTMKFNDIVDIIGKPNVTDLDDPAKVPASWGFEDDKGNKAFVWAYRYYGDITECSEFSLAGDRDLLTKLFGDSAKL